MSVQQSKAALSKVVSPEQVSYEQAKVPSIPQAPNKAKFGSNAPVSSYASDPNLSEPEAVSPSRACPQCGHENIPSHLFCGACGFRLPNSQGFANRGSGRPVSSKPSAGSPDPNLEYRQEQSRISMTVLRADGSEAGTYPLPLGTFNVGRDAGGIFSGDSYLSPKHASLIQKGGKLFVRDESSLNGVYIKLYRDVPVELKPKSMFRIGQEIILFEPLAEPERTQDDVPILGSPSHGYIGRIALVIGRENTGNAFPVPEMGIHLGRERGEILFPDDGYVSGLHCRIAKENGLICLTDLGSSNGTFLRISGAPNHMVELNSGDILLMGQQLFRINYLA